MKIKLLTTLLLLTSLVIYSQNKNRILHGFVLDKLGPVPDAHVINKSQKRGAYSDINGEFTITAKENDSIHISSVGYKTFKIKVNNQHFSIQNNNFNLEKITIELDEVEVKKHDLTGNLESDQKKTPVDRRAKALKSTMDFSNIDMDAPRIEPIDQIQRTKAPDSRLMTDPTAAFAGVGGAATIPWKNSEKLWALREDLAFKEGMPKKLLSELGEKFFFEELKIPVDRYYHFLEYCNPLGIEKLYKKGKTLEVIKILRQEHVTYLDIIKKE
ncbi:carboxypeptidase-like regulatory domain-containing protein [Tenacibaculum geojense]|uniref:Carboxypeptidase-like regulatory domain-containing protein n=1 Tax=Tenacibaculum geojense TaxID=915352 RepID=A0ABW3JQ00_9FLAO